MVVRGRSEIDWSCDMLGKPRVRWRFPMLIRPLLVVLLVRSAFAATAPATPTASSFPELTYSTYLRDGFTPYAIATDSSGNVYLAGSATEDAATSQTTALVVKINPQTNQYLYVRYLGGSLYDVAYAIAVDSAGNAYVAGATTSPEFPVTPGGNLGTASKGGNDQKSFVAKLDPNGILLFSDLLGGSSQSQAQAVAVNSGGQILVSGISNSSGFPPTLGAYSFSNTLNHPYLFELDPTGTKMVFFATGIGGTALALDISGNIYVAGTTTQLDYPTTPGLYQTTFPVFSFSVPPNPGGFQGPNQYVTKVDPTGSKLIYSTSVSGTNGTTNAGIAVDSAGDVYLTGLAAATYPYTIPPPVAPGPSAPGAGVSGSGAPGINALPFLAKLDPAGEALVFSVPVGGAGVQVDSSGNAYAGGMIGTILGSGLGFDVAGPLPGLAGVPSQCLPNAIIASSAYVSQVDTLANVRGSQFIGGSTLSIFSAALSGQTLWIAGPTNLPDFAFSPNALSIPTFAPGPLPGAYLGVVDFSKSQQPAGTPQIGCIVDAANFALAGPMATYQLLTIFGTGLAPAKGVSVTNYTTGELSGVEVSFGSTGATLLYVSSNQINFAVPSEPAQTAGATMQVTVNGVSSAARELPLTFANPSLFLAGLPATASDPFATVLLALNADGSVNSSTNPARGGSVISVFLNGILYNGSVGNEMFQLSANNGWTVTGYTQPNPFVLQVNLLVPTKLVNDFSCPEGLSMCSAIVQISDLCSINFSPQSASLSGVVVGGAVYVNDAQ